MDPCMACTIIVCLLLTSMLVESLAKMVRDAYIAKVTGKVPVEPKEEGDN